MKPYAHQTATIERLHATGGRLLNASDPGTGKTFTVLKWFEEHRAANPQARMIVLAPRAICHPAWAQDAKKFTPALTVAVAVGPSAKKWETVNSTLPDILITNHDSVTQPWFQEVAAKYNACVVDESTAFKNIQAKRTKALLSLSKHWKHRIAMSGTPMPQSILDLYAQMRFVEPALVGPFSVWRSQVCVPKTIMVGNGRSVLQWAERDGVRSSVMTRYANNIVRYAKADCLDLPPQITINLSVPLKPALRKSLDDFMSRYAIQIEDTVITAAHAGSMAVKLLQLSSGFAYYADTEGKTQAKQVDPARYELVTELVHERRHSLVAVKFTAQARYLAAEFEQAGLSFAILDGSTPPNEQQRIVNDFQAGMYRVLICQPQSVAHGVTLTRADTIIWTSPTFNAEHYIQFNARIDRIGQDKKSEVICIAAEGTYEEKAFARVQGKVDNQQGVLDMLRDFTRGS